MSEHMKKSLINNNTMILAHIIIEENGKRKKINRSFKIPYNKIQTVLTLIDDYEVNLKNISHETSIIENTDDDEWIPADEVFKEDYAKYTRQGVNLKGSRYKEELTQVELAKKLGITQSDLSKMENGKRPIGKKMAKRLGKALNVGYKVFL